ncbi:unnamed protein product [Boreogadus saida]
MEAFYTEVKHYLHLNTYHSLTTTAPNPESRKANIRRVSKTYLLKDEELYYRHKNEARLVVCSNERARDVLRECHDNLGTGGHPGRRRTMEKIKDVKKWVIF